MSGAPSGSRRRRPEARAGHARCLSFRSEKTFISNAGIADSYVVFAKTNESISAFLVDAGAAGLSAEPLELLAEHPIGTLRFSKCPARLLGQEGAGLKLALGTLDVFR